MHSDEPSEALSREGFAHVLGASEGPLAFSVTHLTHLDGVAESAPVWQRFME